MYKWESSINVLMVWICVDDFDRLRSGGGRGEAAACLGYRAWGVGEGRKLATEKAGEGQRRSRFLPLFLNLECFLMPIA